MRTITVTVVSFYLTLCNPLPTSAKIVINEISPASDPEWVELYSDNNDSLNGCTLYLHGTEDTRQKILFAEDLKIENYFVVKKGEYNWTTNWLKNDGDTVKISCPDFEDSHTFEDPKGRTIGRSPDGTGSFYVLSSSSEGSANSPPTPPPTPKPTVTPKPTASPARSTPSASDTGGTKPSSTPVAVIKTPTPSPTDLNIFEDDEPEEPDETPLAVLSSQTTQDVKSFSTIEPEKVEEQDVQESPNYLPYGFVGAGSALLLAGAYPFAKKIYNERHAQNSQIP